MKNSDNAWTEVGPRGRAKASSQDQPPVRYQWDSQQSQAIADWFTRDEGFFLTSPLDEAKVLSIDPASYEGQMLLTLQSLFDNFTDAASAALKMLSLIFSGEDDATNRFVTMTGLIVIKAATHVDSEARLRAMAAMLVDIAKSPRSLPHAVSYHKNDETELKKLPGFGLTFTESMQGAYTGNNGCSERGEF